MDLDEQSENSAENRSKPSENSVRSVRDTLRKAKFFSLLLVGLLFVVAGVVLNFWKFNQNTNYVFALNEEGYRYQIIKCWKTDPPTYWLIKTNTEENKTIRRNNCTFEAVAVMPLKESTIAFDQILNRNLRVEGTIVREHNTNFYDLSSAKVDRSSVPTPTPRPKEQLVITRQTENGVEEIFRSNVDSGGEIIQWQNYLFINAAPGYSAGEKLLRHNLETGTTEVVYADDTDRYLDFFQVIEGNLYFSVSGYLMEADMFWLDTASSKPQKLESPEEYEAQSIKYMDDRYWLVGGEGDACWGITTYALIDLKTKRISPVAKSTVGCFDGDEFIGIDTENRMILSSHVIPDEGAGREVYDNPVFTNLYAIQLSNPQQRTMLLDESEMPDTIRGVSYLGGGSRVVLNGDDLYVFDLRSNELRKITSIPSGLSAGTVYNWDNDMLCLRNTAMSSGEKQEIQVSLADGSIEQSTEYCSIDDQSTERGESYEERKKRELNAMLSKLDLPANYSVRYEMSKPFPS